MDKNIPKKLFMIWLGDRIPTYAGMSFKAFQQVNPEFKCVFIHRTYKQLEDIWFGKLEDKPLKRALDRTVSCKDTYVKWQKDFYGSDDCFIQLLADVARIEILNEYGGIYVDCDAFPITKFDDILLSQHFFCVKRKGGTGQGYFCDNFFLGKSCIGNNIENPYQVSGSFFVDHTQRCESIPTYYLLKRKFFAGQLKIGEHVLPSSCYVDHYCSRTWKQTPNNQERWFD